MVSIKGLLNVSTPELMEALDEAIENNPKLGTQIFPDPRNPSPKIGGIEPTFLPPPRWLTKPYLEPRSIFNRFKSIVRKIFKV
ncbi:hypothetical protein NBRC116492_10770 [Aurantivibrio infirmus]